MMQRSDEAASARSGSADRFGYEWHRYAEIRPEYEDQFRRWTVHLQPDDWRGLTFLDVGCGMGRNSYWPMVYGAKAGLAIDLDERSLAAAHRTLSTFPAVRVERRSAYEIGYQDAFDLVFSIGVIHHLAEPERAINAMVRAAKPGGRILIWVYGREGNRLLLSVLNPLRRLLFARLPVRLVHHLSLYPTAILWLALRLGLGRTAYLTLLRRFSFPHLRSIAFDQMLPRIAHYWERETVERLLREQGLMNVEVAAVNDISWSAIGTKPALPMS
jgi:SAM-dependent methyltransferase